MIVTLSTKGKVGIYKIYNNYAKVRITTLQVSWTKPNLILDQVPTQEREREIVIVCHKYSTKHFDMGLWYQKQAANIP